MSEQQFSHGQRTTAPALHPSRIRIQINWNGGVVKTIRIQHYTNPQAIAVGVGAGAILGYLISRAGAPATAIDPDMETTCQAAWIRQKRFCA